MSVQLVVDMNLSVEWVAELASHGWSAVHWSTVGDPRADDSVIMAWALANGHGRRRYEEIPRSSAATAGIAESVAAADGGRNGGRP